MATLTFVCFAIFAASGLASAVRVFQALNDGDSIAFLFRMLDFVVFAILTAAVGILLYFQIVAPWLAAASAVLAIWTIVFWLDRFWPKEQTA